VLFCVMCVICVLCLIVVPLLPGRNPFAININNIIKRCFVSLSQVTNPPTVLFGQSVIDGIASLLVSGEMDNDHWDAQ
jgi:hypothetical protein